MYTKLLGRIPENQFPASQRDFGDKGMATNFLSNKASRGTSSAIRSSISMLQHAKLKRKRESSEIEQEHCQIITKRHLHFL